MKERIEQLRKEGKSYSEISKITGLVKSTISYYVGNRTGKGKLTAEKRNCRNCEKEISSPKVFCDKKCDFEYKQKLRLDKFEKSNLCTNNSIRKALISINGNKCSICEISEIWNDRKLTMHVDHIDGNSDNNDNKNVRLVCPNCHSQLETSKNKVKKQTKRNKYLRKYKGYIDAPVV